MKRQCCEPLCGGKKVEKKKTTYKTWKPSQGTISVQVEVVVVGGLSQRQGFESLRQIIMLKRRCHAIEEQSSTAGVYANQLLEEDLAAKSQL